MDELDYLFKAEDYQQKLGPNIIEQFVKSYDLAGMIAELIQNDFDANSRRLRISFLKDRLVVESYGLKVEKNGWKRLSFWLGIPDDIAKMGGIGKKNFGLRSLFLVGDRIVISSGGYKTGLIFNLGARKKRIQDSATYPKGLSFRLEIQYRDAPLWNIPVFTKKREEQLFTDLEKYLAVFTQLLVCIEQQEVCATRRGKYLLRPYEVEINSERLQKSILCTATARKDKLFTNLMHRNIYLRVLENGEVRSHTNRVAEIIVVISHMRGMPIDDIPPFYLTKDTRKLLASISFALDNRGKTPLIETGRLHYPIGMRDQCTGLGFSLNASFLLDMDRDRIVQGNDWNQHLAIQTGKRMGTVFSTILLPRFGVKAYLLLTPNDNESACPEFMKNSLESMRRYIVNDNYEPASKIHRRQYCKLDNNNDLQAYLPAKILDEVVIPLLDFYPLAISNIGRDRILSLHLTKVLADLDSSTLRNLLNKLQIKPFTIHNVCELLVNVNGIKQSFGHGNSWRFPSYVSFKKHFSSIINVQLVLNGLHKQWDLLTSEEKQAIKETNWLLAADGSNQSFNRLHLWHGDMRDFAWPEKDTILHPELANHPIFRRKDFKLEEFNVISKIEEKAEEWPLLDETDKVKIFKFIISSWKHIFNIGLQGKRQPRNLKRIKDIARTYPILKDSRGGWSTTSGLRIVDSNTKIVFGDSISYPAKIIPRQLLLLLGTPVGPRIPEDILKRCDTLESSERWEIFKFEDYLSRKRLSKKVRSAIYERLWSVCRLENDERIEKTSAAYIPSERILRVLGEFTVPYIVIRNNNIQKFYKRIGTKEQPDFNDMVKYLNTLVINREYLKDRQVFYSELSKAAKQSELAKEIISSQNIIMIGYELYPPERVIISRHLYRYFRNGIRYWPESKIARPLRESLKRLGCKEKVARNHIVDYLNWVSREYKDDALVGFKEKLGIHRAYRQLERYRTEEIDENAQVFLSRSGRLFSKRDIDRDDLCIDDLPQLANGLTEKGVSLEFGDYGDGRQFIDSVEVKPLSWFIKNVKVILGNKVRVDRNLSKQLFSRWVKNAIMSANTQLFDKILDHERLLKLKSIAIYDRISKIYDISSVSIEMQAEVAIIEEEDYYVLCLSLESGNKVDDFIESCSDISKEISLFLRDAYTSSVEIENFLMIMLLLSGSEDAVKNYLSTRNIDYIDYLRRIIDKGEEKEEGEEEAEEEEKEEGEEEAEEEEEEEVTLEDLKKIEASTKGKKIPATTTERPDEVVEMQMKIKRLYQKCQICGLPVFEGARNKKVYGHLRGHHLIPWQKQKTVVDGMISLCQPHHHMVHYARAALFKVNKTNKAIEVIVNGQSVGYIDTTEGHDVAGYIIQNAGTIERYSENTRIEIVS